VADIFNIRPPPVLSLRRGKRQRTDGHNPDVPLAIVRIQGGGLVVRDAVTRAPFGDQSASGPPCVRS
jgi:hypothetical protein